MGIMIWELMFARVFFLLVQDLGHSTGEEVVQPVVDSHLFWVSKTKTQTMCGVNDF